MAPQKLLVLFILLPSFLCGQNIPKNANVIIVKNVVFDKVVNTLLDSGYVIDKIDKQFQTIKTEYKKICTDCVLEILFNVRVKDSTATITGKWRSTGDIFGLSSQKSSDEAMVFDIANVKSRVDRYCFNAMNKFALSLSKDVTYLKQ